MNRTPKPPRPQRSAVLIVAHPDHHLEVFGLDYVDVKVVRVPAVAHRHNEIAAEEVAAAMAPTRYRAMWRADRLRAVATTRPLTIEAAHVAVRAGAAIKSLNAIAAEFDPVMQGATHEVA